MGERREPLGSHPHSAIPARSTPRRAYL
jgi:hypothetical protein